MKKKWKKVFCITNQKGGVGKTTTAVNLGACLAIADQKVLIIDIDPQGNATTGLGLEKTGDGANIYNALINGRIEEDMIHSTVVDGLFAIPSTTDLYGAEVEMVAFENREFRLTRLVEGRLPAIEVKLNGEMAKTNPSSGRCSMKLSTSWVEIG